MDRTRKPQWWLLFLLVPLLLGLFYIESRFGLSAPARHFAQVAIVLLVFALIYRWLSGQSAVLLQPPADDAPYEDQPARNDAVAFGSRDQNG